MSGPVTPRPATGLTRSLRTAIALLLGTAVVLVATWASVVDHPPVVRGGAAEESDTAQAPRGEAEPPPPEPDGDAAPAEDRREVPTLLARVLQAVILFLVCAAGVLTLVALLDRLRRRGRPRRDGPGPLAADEAEVDDLGAVAAAILDDADDQVRELRRGSARNGIVEAWHRFELQAERGGLRRQPWETSSELTLRVLDLVRADAGAVRRLADLYREARFSDHELTEAHREAALGALTELHDQLGSRRRVVGS